jgi:hypothetical protein
VILIVGSTSRLTAEFSVIHSIGPSTLFQGQVIDESLIYHTSLADCRNLEQFLTKFKLIYWAHSAISEFNNYQDYFETLYLLKSHGNVIGIDNVDPYNIKNFSAIKNDESNIVFFGCSHTAGGHHHTKDTEYVNLLSTHFNQPILNLAESGKGNFRSFDLFNNLEFYKNQKVILQLTDFARLKFYPDSLPTTVFKESQLYKIKNRSYFDVYNDKQLIYMTLTRLDSVIKYSRSFGLNFVFFYLGDTPNFSNIPENDFYKKTVEYYLLDYKEYIPNILQRNVDRGTDNLHYGPLSHKIWANEIINKIQTLYP